MSTSFFDAVLYSGQNEPNHDGLHFSEPVGCLNGDMTAHEYKTLWYAAVSDIEKLQTRMVEAADMLRRQHEAIKQLREACQKVVAAFDALPRDNEARYSDLQINAARIALKDTEKFK